MPTQEEARKARGNWGENLHQVTDPESTAPHWLGVALLVIVIVVAWGLVWWTK